jgi:hypothetical protein
LRQSQIELAKHYAFGKVLSGQNSPYAMMLRTSLQKKTMQDIKKNLRTVLNCTDEEIEEILIPEEILDTMIKN